jgi:hypothetical protein
MVGMAVGVEAMEAQALTVSATSILTIKETFFILVFLQLLQ